MQKQVGLTGGAASLGAYCHLLMSLRNYLYCLDALQSRGLQIEIARPRDQSFVPLATDSPL